MEEKENSIVGGFNGFEVEFDNENRILGVKYKGEDLSGIVSISGCPISPDEKPTLTLRILADVENENNKRDI